MELVKARIKENGDVAILEKCLRRGRLVYHHIDTNRVFTADELEELGPYEEQQPHQQPNDPLAQLPQEMVQMITDMVNGYIDRFDAMYWQRQRVEIVKVLMNRLDVATFDPIAICELADKYIQMLKNYE